MKELRQTNLIRWIEARLREWDPISVIGDSRIVDCEYDFYAPKIAELLICGANTKRLEDHLNNLETVAMGLHGNETRNRDFAEALMSGFELGDFEV